jgi:hypothetical protein
MYVWDRVRGLISVLPGRLGRTIPEGMSMSRNGGRIAFDARTRGRLGPDVWVWDRRQGYRRAPRIVRINGHRVHTEYGAKPEISGDGRRVSYLFFPSADPGVMACAGAAVWDLRTGTARAVSGYEGQAGGQRRCFPYGGNSESTRAAPSVGLHGTIAAFTHPVLPDRVAAVNLATGVTHVLSLRSRIAGFQRFGAPASVAVSSTTTTAVFTVQEGEDGGLATHKDLVRWNWAADSVAKIALPDPEAAPATDFVQASEDARTIAYLGGSPRSGYVWIDD